MTNFFMRLVIFAINRKYFFRWRVLRLCSFFLLDILQDYCIKLKVINQQFFEPHYNTQKWKSLLSDFRFIDINTNESYSFSTVIEKVLFLFFQEIIKFYIWCSISTQTQVDETFQFFLLNKLHYILHILSPSLFHIHSIEKGTFFLLFKLLEFNFLILFDRVEQSRKWNFLRNIPEVVYIFFSYILHKSLFAQ